MLKLTRCRGCLGSFRALAVLEVLTVLFVLVLATAAAGHWRAMPFVACVLVVALGGLLAAVSYCAGWYRCGAEYWVEPESRRVARRETGRLVLIAVAVFIALLGAVVAGGAR